MKKVLISVFVAGLVLSGCGVGNIATSPVTDSLSEKAAQEAGEQIAEKMMGGIDIEFAEEGSGDVVAWPKQMPSDVPVFKYGKIDATMAAPEGSGDNGLVVSFREVEKGAYDKYKEDLKNAGWEINTDPGWTDNHVSATKGNFTVDIDVDYMGENTAALYLLENTPRSD